MRVFKLKTKLISALLMLLVINPLSAVERSLKAHIEYKLEYDEEIPLRVTQIPTDYGMNNNNIDTGETYDIQYDLMGYVEKWIEAENVEECKYVLYLFLFGILCYFPCKLSTYLQIHSK